MILIFLVLKSLRAEAALELHFVELINQKATYFAVLWLLLSAIWTIIFFIQPFLNANFAVEGVAAINLLGRKNNVFTDTALKILIER